ncbi:MULTISPECIES: DUF3721 domain-containing protein [Prochlorococcus]|uniref:DUF3721 domain-containing protein n=1 Tax=Prochlorococcus TaxID=1218 RepID=UPI0009077C90|nr:MULTISPECIES: DUF3721 domain-containing protein [Prochlorococcus]
MTFSKFSRTILSVLGPLSVALVSGSFSDATEKGIPSIFNTEEEAVKAAKDFNCIGAHKMGDVWMPCKDHHSHEHHHH